MPAGESQTFRSKPVLCSVTFATAMAVLWLTATASASIAGDGGTITTCYPRRSGVLHVIDLDHGEECLTSEQVLPWQQHGTPRPVAPAGATNVQAFNHRFGNVHIPDGVHGALLSIEQYTQLYEVIGTMYGGDGRNTFALPDLRAFAPGHVSYAIVLYGPTQG